MIQTFHTDTLMNSPTLYMLTLFKINCILRKPLSRWISRSCGNFLHFVAIINIDILGCNSCKQLQWCKLSIVVLFLVWWWFMLCFNYIHCDDITRWSHINPQMFPLYSSVRGFDMRSLMFGLDLLVGQAVLHMPCHILLTQGHQ